MAQSEIPRFSGLLRQYLGESKKPFDAQAHLLARASLLPRKAARREVSAFQTAKLNWRIFSEGVAESALNFQGAYANFNAFVALVKEIAGDQLSTDELFGAIHAIFTACSTRADEARCDLF